MQEKELPGKRPQSGKPYLLEARTEQFARDVRRFIKRLRLTVANVEDAKQLVRSSGSVGANYVEANEALGKKDFLFHIRVCRKESKESGYWLRLIDVEDAPALDKERGALDREAGELMSIFGAIVRKSE